MKNTINKIALTVLVAFMTFSFTGINSEIKEIKTDKSNVVWKAYKVTGSHIGIISLKSGSLKFEENKLIGGEFVVDMTTLSSTDMTGEYKGKLEGHLKSDDFFAVKNHPEASLIFTDVAAKGKNSYTVTGDLTIKEKMNKVSFEISIYGNKATASLKVDRTLYDIKYGSTSFFDGLKDKAIYDEFDLVVDLEF